MADRIDNGGPAFPTEPNMQPGFYHHHGMSLRDWFAGQALPAAIQMCTMDAMIDGESAEQMFARKAYQCADAMIAASRLPPKSEVTGG